MSRSGPRTLGALLVLLSLWALIGCGGSDPAGDAADPADPVADSAIDSVPETVETEPTEAEAPETTAREGVEREGIDGGFGEVAITITGPDGETCELCLLLADTSELRSQGLMRVTDPELGGYDGMLFDHGAIASGGYWMKNTPMPLSIAYWDEGGTFVSSVDMEPCLDDPAGGCPAYTPDGPYRWALEVTRGGLDEILAVEGATLRVDATDCSAAPV